MKKTKFIALAILIPSIFILTSCLENDIPEASDEILFTEVQQEINTTSLGDAAIDGAEEAVSSFNTNSGLKVNGIQKAVSPYPIVTKLNEGSNFPKVYEINFGDNFIDKYGRVFRGSIYCIAKSYKESEFKFGSVTIDPIDEHSAAQSFTNKFYVNDNLVEGYRKSDVLVRGVLNIVSDINITNHNTNQLTYRYTERKRTVTDNNDTPNIYTDDSYAMTGTCVGNIFVKGNEFEFSSSIEKPLQLVPGWKYFVSGVSVIEIGNSTQTTDFGEGALDNIAIRNLNGNIRTIFLNW